MSRILLVTALVLGLGATAVGQATAERESLAVDADPRGAKGRTLGLSRVTVPAGAALARHRHTGTQIARIDEGTLTYTVVRGSVTVRSGAADDNPTVVRRISAGQTGRIKAGQWIVEQPNVVHEAANRGTKKIVIYLATLLPNGDPPSVPAK